MKNRQAAKVDNNQTDIVEALRKIPGVSVQIGHDDILVGHMGNNYWFEIKNPESVSKKTGEVKESQIRDSQKYLIKYWEGQYDIVWRLDQILRIIGLEKPKE